MSLFHVELREHLSLSTCAPHILQKTITLSKTVQAVITLASGAYESAKGIDLVFASVAAILVNLADADLYGSVVLGFDNAVGSTALAQRVIQNEKIEQKMKMDSWRGQQKYVQIDDFSLLVLHFGEIDSVWSLVKWEEEVEALLVRLCWLMF
ncbi:hypothetical protein LOZ66_003968 [Ophidiomyces ophidiicola]|nr:hypothetical protein LOZ66_003968 [Ophidiomyces ophidiicola]